MKMECVHVQRIPPNTKIVLVADIDNDGLNEMIIGLTDRVVRSYRWSSHENLGSGKLIGLNKWECANQIGTVTIQVHTIFYFLCSQFKQKLIYFSIYSMQEMVLLHY